MNFESQFTSICSSSSLLSQIRNVLLEEGVVVVVRERAYVGEEMEDQQTKGSEQVENENHDLTFFFLSSSSLRLARTIDLCRNIIIIEDEQEREWQQKKKREEKIRKKINFYSTLAFFSYHCLGLLYFPLLAYIL